MDLSYFYDITALIWTKRLIWSCGILYCSVYGITPAVYMYFGLKPHAAMFLAGISTGYYAWMLPVNAIGLITYTVGVKPRYYYIYTSGGIIQKLKPREFYNLETAVNNSNFELVLKLQENFRFPGLDYSVMSDLYVLISA